MPSEAAYGDTTATGAEQTLDTRTADGVYQLFISTANMAADDELELRVKVKPNNAASSRELAYYAIYRNAQGLPIKSSVPVTGASVEFTLKQTAGTYRSYKWSVRRLDA